MATVWQYWSSSTTTSATTISTWNYWTTNAYTYTTTASTSYTWDAWNIVTPVPLTAEQQEAHRRQWAEQQERWRLQQLEQQREADEAKERARTLLRSCLTKRQRDSLDQAQYFDVRSIRPDGQETTYRIKQGSAGNVYELDAAGRESRRFCIHPSDVPAEDAMLAQKLLIETDIAAFERIANITRLRAAS